MSGAGYGIRLHRFLIIAVSSTSLDKVRVTVQFASRIETYHVNMFYDCHKFQCTMVINYCHKFKFTMLGNDSMAVSKFVIKHTHNFI